MRALRGVVVVVTLGFVLAGCATVDIKDRRVVTGRVTDESGRPVANSPVVIVGRSLDMVKTRLTYEERGRREVKGATDNLGRYRIEFVPATQGNNFFLFFYDTTGFDQVKFRRPEPLDITPLLGQDRELTISQVLRFNPAWPEVERQIAFYGQDSERSQILRQHGLPEKREPSGTGGPDSEVWWYYGDGVSYWFSGGKLTSTHKFQPIPGATPGK